MGIWPLLGALVLALGMIGTIWFLAAVLDRKRR